MLIRHGAAMPTRLVVQILAAEQTVTHLLRPKRLTRVPMHNAGQEVPVILLFRHKAEVRVGNAPVVVIMIAHRALRTEVRQRLPVSVVPIKQIPHTPKQRPVGRRVVYSVLLVRQPQLLHRGRAGETA